MASLLIIHNSNNLNQEQDEILDQLSEWNLFFIDGNQFSIESITRKIRNEEIHFLLYSRDLDMGSSAKLSRIHKEFPLLTIIYYHSQLKSGEFADLYQAGIDYCIIGDARQVHLVKTLSKLWAEHWKRVPQSLLHLTHDEMPPRATQILKYIENKSIRQLNTSDLSDALHISESHFRSEFKKYFNHSFREFKQLLFSHYESVLLFEKEIKPKAVFEILDYKNLSAFSRSFKMRHGNSWQEMRRKRKVSKKNFTHLKDEGQGHGKRPEKI